MQLGLSDETMGIHPPDSNALSFSHLACVFTVPAFYCQLHVFFFLFRGFCSLMASVTFMVSTLCVLSVSSQLLSLLPTARDLQTLKLFNIEGLLCALAYLFPYWVELSCPITSILTWVQILILPPASWMTLFKLVSLLSLSLLIRTMDMVISSLQNYCEE